MCECVYVCTHVCRCVSVAQGTPCETEFHSVGPIDQTQVLGVVASIFPCSGARKDSPPTCCQQVIFAAAFKVAASSQFSSFSNSPVSQMQAHSKLNSLFFLWHGSHEWSRKKEGFQKARSFWGATAPAAVAPLKRFFFSLFEVKRQLRSTSLSQIKKREKGV